jgi:hypothetical protein
MHKISIAVAAILLAGSASLALAQDRPGSDGGVQGGADGTAQATTGAPGTGFPGGTGTAGSGPTYPAEPGLTDEPGAPIGALVPAPNTDEQVLAESEPAVPRG